MSSVMTQENFGIKNNLSIKQIRQFNYQGNGMEGYFNAPFYEWAGKLNKN